jgi:hypothetical protein
VTLRRRCDRCFVYLRLHSSEELYASGYSNDALNQFAARIKLCAEGRRQITHAEPLPISIHRSASRVMSMPISTTTRRSASRSRRGRCERGWRDYPVKPGKSRKKSESGRETARLQRQKSYLTQLLMRQIRVWRNRETMRCETGNQNA